MNALDPALNPSPLLALPWVIREQIILWAFTTGDTVPGVGPVIRIQGIPAVPTRQSVQNGIAYTLRWIPEESSTTCHLAQVNSQLNYEVELTVFFKFPFLFASGLTRNSIQDFVDSLSTNAKYYFRHFIVYWSIPMAPPGLLPAVSMFNTLYQDLYVQLRPSGIFAVLWNSLPCVKKNEVLIEAERTSSNLSAEEQRYIVKLGRDVCAFMSCFKLNRQGWHSRVPPFVLNILNTPDQFERQFPRSMKRSYVSLQNVKLEEDVPSIQIVI